jgi:hypothetical protein
LAWVTPSLYRHQRRTSSSIAATMGPTWLTFR